MWSYYGAKTNIIDYYPAPKFDKIIEPFAGTARYALKYFDHDILLVDKYDVIIKIWKWLQQCSPEDIKKLPRFKVGDNINKLSYDCEEARLLTGFLTGFGRQTPTNIATIRHRDRPKYLNYRINFIANNLWKIKHWKIKLGTYEDIPNQKATWFIDPPYQIGGNQYKENNSKINYNYLSEWTKKRKGQIIVCENMNANWLPFIPMIYQNIKSGKYLEAIWSNYPTEFDNKQLTIF